MVGRIRVEKNESAAALARRGFDQRKDSIPDLGYLPSSAYRATLRERAQQFRTFAFAQVVRERWSQRAGRAVNQVGAIALDLIKSQNETELAQRLTRTPGEIEASRICAV